MKAGPNFKLSKAAKVMLCNYQEPRRSEMKASYINAELAYQESAKKVRFTKDKDSE